MSLSTKIIFSKLGRPTAYGQSSSSSDADNAVLQLKIESPKFRPPVKSKEDQSLLKEFDRAKHMLENFKDVLRQKGIDVTNYSVSMDKKTGRISYTIPNLSHYHLFKNNKTLFSKPAPAPDVSVSRRMKM